MTSVLLRTVLAEAAISVLPVLAFLVALQLIDTYKLLPARRVWQMIAAGCAAAVVCFALNTALYAVGIAPSFWARSGAPALEEAAKAAWIFRFIRARRIGFMGDAAVSGFAVGAGFAVLENLSYLPDLSGTALAGAALRGFGTAMMHGGATAIFAVIAINRAEMGRLGVNVFAPGFAIAVAMHMFYNQPVLTPVAKAVALLIFLPALLSFICWRSEKALEHWVGVKLDKDIDLLQMIATGEFSASHAGTYLSSLESAFGPVILGDMLCYLQLALELSAQAKGDLLRREMEFPVEPDPELPARLTELRYLEKQIGRAGKMALAPLLGSSYREVWDFQRLSE